MFSSFDKDIIVPQIISGQRENIWNVILDTAFLPLRIEETKTCLEWRILQETNYKLFLLAYIFCYNTIYRGTIMNHDSC